MPLPLVSIIQIVAEIALIALIYFMLSRRASRVEVALAHAFDRIAELERLLAKPERRRVAVAPVIQPVEPEDDTQSVSTGFSVAEEDTFSVYNEEPVTLEPEPAPELKEDVPIINELQSLDEGPSE